MIQVEMWCEKSVFDSNGVKFDRKSESLCQSSKSRGSTTYDGSHKICNGKCDGRDRAATSSDEINDFCYG